MAKHQNSIRKMFFHFSAKNGKPMIIFGSLKMIIFGSFFAPCLALCSFSPTHPRKILIGWSESWIIWDFSHKSHIDLLWKGKVTFIDETYIFSENTSLRSLKPHFSSLNLPFLSVNFLNSTFLDFDAS